ncbi:MAG TPA: HlyD family efflux transporter periplasmic adaptor subunit [Gemmatimonadaceae bacterium]|nr:HlyD family efflux transporter periplasmic adaptor subunit [Gemmatimonadaceae bacterium]
MSKKPRILAAAVVLSTIGGFFLYRTMSAAQPETIIASGTVEATQADLGFQIAGRLAQISVREGDDVSLGVELASLDRAELLAQRDAAMAQVAGAEAVLRELTNGARREELAQARASLAVAVERREAARRDLARLTPLAEQSLVSRQEFDRQRTELSVAEGEASKAVEELHLLETGPRTERIAAQRAALAQAQATVARIDAMLEQATLRAPFNGTIVVRHREPGEALPSGLPVLTLRNFDDRWVRIYVPGDEVGRLAVGQTAMITADSYENRSYTGTVSYIADVAEFTPRNVQTTKDRVKLVYEVRVRITGDANMDLKPGLPADVQFHAASASGE